MNDFSVFFYSFRFTGTIHNPWQFTLYDTSTVLHLIISNLQIKIHATITMPDPSVPTMAYATMFRSWPNTILLTGRISATAKEPTTRDRAVQYVSQLGFSFEAL